MAFSAILKKIRKIKCLAHPALLLFISGIAHAQPISVSDDTGQKLQFSQPVQRIIALSPAITENRLCRWGLLSRRFWRAGRPLYRA